MGAKKKAANPPNEIIWEDFLDELSRPAGVEGETVGEIAKRLGLDPAVERNHRKVRLILKAAKQQNRLVCERDLRETIAGVLTPTPIYRITAE